MTEFDVSKLIKLMEAKPDGWVEANAVLGTRFTYKNIAVEHNATDAMVKVKVKVGDRVVWEGPTTNVYGSEVLSALVQIRDTRDDWRREEANKLIAGELDDAPTMGEQSVHLAFDAITVPRPSATDLPAYDMVRAGVDGDERLTTLIPWTIRGTLKSITLECESGRHEIIVTRQELVDLLFLIDVYLSWTKPEEQKVSFEDPI